MKFLLVIVALVVLALAGGWWLDRKMAKRGYRVAGVRHTGFSREITYEKLDDDLPTRPGTDPRE
ncbi:MAG: hypothetical protein ACJ74O_03820 [Frankiaceae bacterium]